MNNLKVLAYDIQNAYLTEKFQENILTVSGPEFVTKQGKFVLVVRALYVLKASGADFRALLSENLYDLGYMPSMADPDVYIITSAKPGGFMYY